MKEYKIFTFEEILDEVRLTQEAWARVKSAPEGEYAQAVLREITWPEGFLEQLKGKELSEQMSYYRIVEEEHYSRTAYGEVTNENKHRFGYALEDYSGLTSLIVNDGILIGVRIKTYTRRYDWGVPAFPYQDICTYYASDDNGSGSKDREDYAHLCCVMPDKTSAEE